MIVKTLECTVGAVDAAFMRVAAAYATPATRAARCHLISPVRSHSTGGVRLYEVKDLGWDAPWSGSSVAKTAIDFTTFPTRLGPPPDHPPVN
ncbi:MAG: hypothetical protein QM650_12010 [Microlunatus sp.]